MKIKILLLTLFALLGLFVGQIAVAATDNNLAAKQAAIQAVMNQIQLVKQQINELIAQEAAKKNPPQVMVQAQPVERELSQSELDLIESEIKIVSQKTQVLKVQVGIFVALRGIQRKTALLAALPKSAASTAATASATSAQTAPAVPTLTTKEQIAKVQQQINELNQELAAKKASESQPVAAAVGTTCDASSGTCSVASPDASQTAPSSAQITIEKAPQEAQKTGFWQAVGDFIRKIFTF